MTTQTIMKARIASDLRRDDLTTDIADYIPQAIADFQGTRYYFNETRAFTFNTVSGTQRYTSAEFPNVVKILKIDSAFATIGGSKYKLWPMQPVHIEACTTNSGSTGQVTHHGFFDRAVWLYPIPMDVWAISMMCVQKYAAPATDGETDNAWMAEPLAARMIRSQTIGHLYAYVIKRPDIASSFYQLAQDASDRLVDQTADMATSGDMLVEAWDPY